jgi:hypothetical protein
MTHGTRASYNNHRCRCAACRQANSQYQKKYMAQPQWRGYMQQVSRDSYHRRKLKPLGIGPLEPVA